MEEKVYQLGMNTGKSCPFCNKNMDVIEIRGEKDFIIYTMVCNCQKVKIEFYDYEKNYNDIKESVKMKNKVIFENEEEAIKQFELCIGYDYKDKKADIEKLNKYIRKCKHHGYIRKSPVEEAEEMYMKWNYNHNNNIENGWSDTVAMIYSLYNGFQYLKASQK